MSFVFSLTCCSDLLEKVGITSTDCWMMLPLSQHVDISSLGVTMVIVSTEEEDCGGTMFVLYLSEPVPPVFDKPCALQRGSKKKKLFTKGKGRENKYLETQFHREEYGGTPPHADISALM